MTVLIVDDHAGFLATSKRLLASEGFDVVGTVADGETALRRADELRPDLVVVDVQLPGMDGFELARRLAGLRDAPAVVLTSSREASDYGPAVGEAPVKGFVGKHELSGARLISLCAEANSPR